MSLADSPKADAIYAFYTTGITDMQEIVLTCITGGGKSLPIGA